MSNNYQDSFSVFSKSIEILIKEINKKKSTLRATDEWTVKDVLCHIVFWHENYAANYKALAEHKDPPIPEGLSTINIAGVLSLQKYSEKELIKKLQKAHKSLRKSIIVKKVPQMTYSRGGKTYKTEDFLEMIARHINTHTKQIKRAK